VTDAGEDFFLWTLFQQLVRRNFAVGLEEYGVVMQALRAGFGWTSRDELREVLCSLWATSREEQIVVATLFDQLVVLDWNADASTGNTQMGTGDVEIGSPSSQVDEMLPATTTSNQMPPPEDSVRPAPAVTPSQRLPPLRSEELPHFPYSHVFLPQYPVRYRDIAQAWRRLRWPLREGPAIELDVEATVRRRSRLGVGSPPVLRPRRRNQAHLLVLVDRQGSMAPFHGYTDEVCAAITQAGRLGHMQMFYFHDTPLEGSDLTVLDTLEPKGRSDLDPVLGDVPALTHGTFFRDKELLEPYVAEMAFKQASTATAVVIISDAGAARGRHDPIRLLETIASLKALRSVSTRIVWLNPLPTTRWIGSTAKQIARHVPMYVMDREGMHRAINVLRGQPIQLEKPLTTSIPSSERWLEMN
jgi:uncharacterized protein with von Willebrand factor type A (vWA) domain